MTASAARRLALLFGATGALLFGCDELTAGNSGAEAEPAQTATATAARTAASAAADSASPSSSAPSSTAAAKTLSASPSCDEFVRVMNCMKSKAPADQRPVIEQSTKQVLELVKTLGPMADQACQQGLEQQQALIAQVGCAKGGDGAATPSGTAPVAGAGKYSTDGIQTIPDSCDEPYVILANAPKDKTPSYTWPWARQALYANPQFRMAAEPKAEQQVAFDVYETEQAILLVARCFDGGTCNRLAAMYQGIVRTAKPQLFCGNLPVKGAKHPALVVPPDHHWLPAPDDAIAKCARLAACEISANPATPGDPGMQCQRAPSSFKLECALKKSCTEVNRCAGG